MGKPDCLLLIAEAVAELINSKRVPRLGTNFRCSCVEATLPSKS